MSGVGGGVAKAAEKPAVVQQADFAHPDVKEQNGYVYVRGTVKSSGDRLKDMKVAETKLMATASKYFNSKEGKGNFVPGGYKEITKKSDFLNGKTNELVYAWKISK
jgi:hypothetical protein